MSDRTNPRAHRGGPGRPLLRPPSLPLLALLAGVGTACAPTEALKPVFAARGQVLLEGKPAAGALVVFHPVGDPAPNALDPRAVVGADGTFALSTHNAEDGAPPGRYEVTVHNSGPEAEQGPRTAAGGRVPPRYQDRTRSGLKAEIVAGDNDIPPFRLTR